ncbi:signal transduction histidine kinase [Solidesulfovibrio carbinoliphilus subsp. oakridgensis]|uniref:histidine kinase n=1 Tax=Solidesulfovibrio carbinoliphilus subsp. oakridgensis TaxID=694327 RepID=G7QDJ7_9BACT|nr:PAS domain S-box protein [Solidesulfovibrio carbinoliphilus]EHJ46503.1 signal transduction histidine kinase [Solidesulfovibrio carbinoliphilus subsp. oakridgensis]
MRATKTNHGGLVSLKPVRIALCYLGVGLGWIFFSDRLADSLFRDNPALLMHVSSFKGFGFVLATSLLLFLLLHRHVAAFRRKELELRESQERYRLVVHNAPDAILIHDGTRFVFANPEAAKLFGADSPNRLVGREVLDFVHDDSKASVRDRIRQNLVQNAPATLREQRYVRLDGSPIEVEVAAVPFSLDLTSGALVFMRDVSQRKAVERNLRESEAKYRLLADNCHDVIFTLDAKLRLTYVSPSVRRLRGLTVDEAVGETFEQMMTPESAVRAAEAARLLGAGQGVDRNTVKRLELEMRRKDGSTVWVESVVRPLIDASGRISGAVGVSRDITERRRMEDELRRSKEFLGMILDAIPDPVFVKDASHRFVLVNQALGAMVGQPQNRILGGRDEDIVPREEAEVFVERDNLVLETGREDLFEEKMTDGLGQVHILVTRKGLFVDASGARFIVGVIRDVTEDKTQEKRLRDSLAEKEVLLKEVHHRVKNNLQVISSLLFLQKDAIEDPAIQDMFEESRNRIASMALIHEELYRSGDLARVDLKEYLERLTPKVVQSLRGRKSLGFALNLTECRVTVDKAIPFGLIVNELVTNAVKHGFTGREAGNIRVTMAREGEMVQAVVEDDGVGLPDGFHPDVVRSLGMQLIVQLTRQLRGALTFGSTAEGTIFRLAFPLGDPTD